MCGLKKEGKVQNVLIKEERQGEEEGVADGIGVHCANVAMKAEA